MTVITGRRRVGKTMPALKFSENQDAPRRFEPVKKWRGKNYLA